MSKRLNKKLTKIIANKVMLIMALTFIFYPLGCKNPPLSKDLKPKEYKYKTMKKSTEQEFQQGNKKDESVEEPKLLASIIAVDQSGSMKGFTTTPINSISLVLQQYTNSLGIESRPLGQQLNNTYYSIGNELTQIQSKKFNQLTGSGYFTKGLSNLSLALDKIFIDETDIGIVITDGFPCEEGFLGRGSFEIDMQSISELASKFFKLLQKDRSVWVILLKFPFNGTYYLCTGQVSPEIKNMIKKKFNTSVICKPECKFSYSGFKSMMIIISSSTTANKLTENVVSNFLNSLKDQKIDDTEIKGFALKLFPPSETTWRLSSNSEIGKITPWQNPPKKLSDVTKPNLNIVQSCDQKEGEIAFHLIVEKLSTTTPPYIEIIDQSPPEMKEISLSSEKTHLNFTQDFILTNNFWIKGEAIRQIQPHGFVKCGQMQSVLKTIPNMQYAPSQDQCQSDNKRCFTGITFCGCLQSRFESTDNVSLDMEIFQRLNVMSFEQIKESVGEFSVDTQSYLAPDKIFGLNAFFINLLNKINEHYMGKTKAIKNIKIGILK